MRVMKKGDDALPVGTMLYSPTNGYRILEVLGTGGFGITYKVQRTGDGRLLAVKEFFPDIMCERGADNTMSYLKTNALEIEIGIDNFITEATRLNDQNIFHPNIVEVYDVFRANNTAYYAMEYIDGKTLTQYMKSRKNKPLSPEQAMSVMRPVLQAVDQLHHYHITHLDIKHDNIVLTFEEDGALRPVLIDFGQSKHYDKKGRATSKLTNAGCSEGFAPMEQYTGLTEFTPQADVYALCATILYLLTGKHPVKASDMSASRIDSLLDSSVPHHIREALIEGMRKNKDDRIQSVSELARLLEVDIRSHDHEASVTRLISFGKSKKSTSDTVVIMPPSKMPKAPKEGGSSKSGNYTFPKGNSSAPKRSKDTEIIDPSNRPHIREALNRTEPSRQERRSGGPAPVMFTDDDMHHEPKKEKTSHKYGEAQQPQRAPQQPQRGAARQKADKSHEEVIQAVLLDDENDEIMNVEMLAPDDSGTSGSYNSRNSQYGDSHGGGSYGGGGNSSYGSRGSNISRRNGQFGPMQHPERDKSKRAKLILMISFAVLILALVSIICINAFRKSGKSGSTGENGTLVENIDKVNSRMPQTVSEGVTMIELKYDKSRNCAIIVVELALPGVDKNSSDVLKEISTGAIQSDGIKSFLKSVIDANAKLEFLYKFKSGSEATNTFTSKELKELTQGKKGDSQSLAVIKEFVTLLNKECPEKLPDGSTLKSVTEDGKKIIYTFQFDKASVKKINDSPTIQKKEVISTLKDDIKDKNYKELMRTCVECGYGIEFKFISPDSKEKASIIISTDEIKDILKNSK